MERFIRGFDWHENSLRPAKTKELGVSNSVGRWNVSFVGSSGTNTHVALRTKEQGVSNPVGRWMKVQGKVSKMQAHRSSRVVMDIAAFKVSHSVGVDIGATALRAARVSTRRGEATGEAGSSPTAALRDLSLAQDAD